MNVLSNPLRPTASGALATVVQGSPEHALEIARAAASTRHGERELSPLYGSIDAVAESNLQVVAAGIEASEPRLRVDSIASAIDDRGELTLDLRVSWEDGS